MVLYGQTILSLTNCLLMHTWVLSRFPCTKYSCKHHFTLTSLSRCTSISLWWIPRRWIIIGSKGMSISFLIAIAKLPSNNFIPIYTFTHTVRRSLFPNPTPLSNTKTMQFRDVWCELEVKRFSLWSFFCLCEKLTKTSKVSPFPWWTPCSEWADTQTDIQLMWEVKMLIPNAYFLAGF